MQPIISTEPDEETALLACNQSKLKDQTVYIYVVAGLSAIGGFLFGYDTGVISGAMLYMVDEFVLNDMWQQAVVSSTLLTAWLFSILSGSATDAFGRKPIILASSVIFIAGSLLLALAKSKWTLLAGRLVVGAGVGVASMTTPMYIAELAPASIRGKLILIYMCCITGGQFVASVIAYLFSFETGGAGWRYMLGIAALPAGVQLVAFSLMPESPRWLVACKRFDEARKVLRKIRPKHSDVAAEFSAICASNVRAKHEQNQLIASMAGSSSGGAFTNATNTANNSQDEDETCSRLLPASCKDTTGNKSPSTLKRILACDACRRALLVGCLLQLVQQCSGINTVMYYSASIIQSSGVHSKSLALALAACAAFVNFVFTIVGYLLVERVGRRKLLLVSLAGVACSLVLLGASFQFASSNSPRAFNDKDVQNQQCARYADCNACTNDESCGYCYTDSLFSAKSASLGSQATPATRSAVRGACLLVDATSGEYSALGNCTRRQLGSEFVFAHNWCPSKYSWLTVLGMVSYLFFFAPGMGPMPWTINSEIYPSWARSWCLSAATSVNWLFNLLVSMSFLSLRRAASNQGAFYTYAAIAFAGLAYFAAVLPETRGKSLEELETLFAPFVEQSRQDGSSERQEQSEVAGIEKRRTRRKKAAEKQAKTSEQRGTEAAARQETRKQETAKTSEQQ